MNKKLLALGVLVTIALTAVATRFAIPPTKGDLTGLWIGYEQSYPYFYRLDLRQQDTGSLVILYPEGNAGVYHVSWELSRSRLRIELTPPNNDSERIACSVTRVDYRRIDLNTTGISGRWTRRASLLNYSDLSAKITQSAAHEPKKAAK